MSVGAGGDGGDNVCACGGVMGGERGGDGGGGVSAWR